MQHFNLLLRFQYEKNVSQKESLYSELFLNKETNLPDPSSLFSPALNLNRFVERNIY